MEEIIESMKQVVDYVSGLVGEEYTSQGLSSSVNQKIEVY